MVFKNLPIDSDMDGRASLRDGEAKASFESAPDGRSRKALNRERMLEKLSGDLGVGTFEIEPVTRICGRFMLSAEIDFANRRTLDAHVECGEFTRQSGACETILKDRRPSDAVHISSRICGSSSGAHAIASAMAVEMAAGTPPPPLAIVARNLASSGEMIDELIHHLFVLAGPDYSEGAVSRTSLSLWARAQKTTPAGVEEHGLESVADLMRGMNPMSGHLYLEALQMARLGREIATLIFGKHPHPTTVVPAGIAVEAHRELFNQVLGRINALLDYSKKLACVWDDLVDFFYEAEPRYARVGATPVNLISAGLWDDPESYDANYLNINEWGSRRMSAPGVIIDGETRSGRLSDVNIGVEEFVDHAYYRQWEGGQVKADPLDGPVSPWHPWNKETLPEPSPRNWKERYSWNAAPRWDREAMETGPLARLWINALGGARNCEFIRPARRSLEIYLPKGQRPATTLRWLIPEKPNVLERNRARAYQVAYAAMVAYADLLKAFDYIRRGESRMSARFLHSEKKISAGFWECGRGMITHHLVIDKSKIANYQIGAPSEWMGSPRDAGNLPGVYEAAMMNTPLLEECARQEDFTGVDILRVMRSFDP
ncbi:MAG TPA: nickel-dependent hydrogenase large subunit [Blastocatellia bacterium]|nr:nickel-dependent hydrogenase large subunit [Blastocatellia bacterium]